EYGYEGNTDTSLVIKLPGKGFVAQGQSITLDLAFTFHLPQKQGRWGQWEGVTFLSNWLPVFAVYDEEGWHPTPFVPWHQPFFNEAGWYSVRAVLPCDQKVACTGTVVSEKELGNGWKQIDVAPCCVRDYAFLCSARFQEYTGMAGPVRVHCLAFPE